MTEKKTEEYSKESLDFFRLFIKARKELCDSSPTETYSLEEAIRRAFDALQPSPSSATAEEINKRLAESLGEPDNSIEDHTYEIRPLTVEGRREWWIFHKEVSSGEPLAQWLNEFATLHAKKIADKMVEERWINVKDRLPRKDGKSSIYCLVNSEYDGIVMRPYNEYHKCWDTEDADDYYCDAVGGKITHWMPLPNPPIK